MQLSENNCAKIILKPDEKYAEKYRFWQGCPTILSTKKYLYTGWYSGGTTEPSHLNYNLLVRSADNGKTWSEPILIIDSVPELSIRAIDIQLWKDPSGKAWLFWVQRYDEVAHTDPRHLRLWAITSENLDDDEPSWSDPIQISEGFLRCQPNVLSDGRWQLWAYDWTSETYNYTETADNGKTWVRHHGGKKVKTPFDETMAVERNDGSILVMARTALGFVGKSESFDGGKTWTNGELTELVAPSSRLFLSRLKSGNLLLIINSHPNERRNMTALLSEDDGETWPWSLLIDEREPVSYPDVVEHEDGMIYMVHDHGRTTYKGMFISSFSEDDIKVGKLINPKSFLNHEFSRAPSEPFDQALYDQQKAEEQEKFH